MKKLLFRSLCLGCLLFVLNFGKAQPVITEYIVMKETVKVDLTDKKLHKSMNAKGILDLVWNTSNSVLAVSYDPKMTDSKEALKTVQELLSLSTVPSIAHPTNSK